MKILFQGDSITDAGRNRESTDTNGRGLGEGYPYMVASDLLVRHPETEWNFTNRAISGDRIVDLYARWKKDCLNIKPDLMSILVGINDTWHNDYGNGVEVDRFGRIYHELLAWTKDTLPDVKLILLEPYFLPFGNGNASWEPEVAQRRDIVAALAKEFGAAFIPTQKLFNDAVKIRPMDYWLADGVHPLPAGHRLIADAWLKAAGLE